MYEICKPRLDRLLAAGYAVLMLIKIILASNSPRRRELLLRTGVSFTVDSADVDETVLIGEPAESYAVRIALSKASTTAGRVKSGVVIGADTIVVLDENILGKPKDDKDAVRMLRMLSGRMHRVITGLAVVEAGTGMARTSLAETKVWFRRLSDDEIAAYVSSREPMDKAGAYGIQDKGALLVERIDGCYFNVVGLPLSLLYNMLRDFGVNLLTGAG